MRIIKVNNKHIINIDHIREVKYYRDDIMESKPFFRFIFNNSTYTDYYFPSTIRKTPETMFELLITLIQNENVKLIVLDALTI